ncbi:MAG TPA: ClcB-like voltage-gated chloride channel protein [Polyangiaceae bacterium]|nr:ClcB-like voltage-gated chloride channel protein [Polyangiaceae bacterium]
MKPPTSSSGPDSAPRFAPRDLYATMAAAALVGLVGAASSSTFRALLFAVKTGVTGHSGGFVQTAEALPWWARLLLPAVGGLLAGVVLHSIKRVLPGLSSTDYMEAISVGDGVIRTRPTLLKILSALLSLASGASIGREGPMVQLASMLASVGARWAKLSAPRRRLLVACGAAAGISSAYNAPIAGALFVAEIVFGSIGMASFGPLLVSSVTASLTIRLVLGTEAPFGTSGFNLVSAWELPAYLALGLVAGAAGPAFLRLLWGSEKAFARLPFPAYGRLALGGLLVGLISIECPKVWGNGYSIVNSMLHSEWALGGLVVVALWKLLATSASFGSGAVGGVFTPTLFMGAALGSCVGIPLHAAWPAATGQPQAYALVGMGCFLAATTRAPLMSIVIVFEMTRNYAIMLPLALACVVAHFLANAIDSRSIYSRFLPSNPGAPAG